MILTCLVVLLTIAVNQKPVQQFLAKKAVAYLANTLKTEVSVETVALDFFDQAVLKGLLVRDLQKDTLLYAGEARVNITDWFFLKEKPVISFVGLKDAVVNLTRTRASNVWNYQFAVDAFTSKDPPKKKKQTTTQPQIDLRKLDLENARFNMVDAWYGADYITSVNRFLVKVNSIDVNRKQIDVAAIEGDGVLIGMTDYKGGKPPTVRRSAPAIDTTAFNPDLWKVTIAQLDLDKSRYYLEYPDDPPPTPGYFDETHLDVNQIKIRVKNINIVGDTIKGKVLHMSCVERCGIEVRDMQADVKVSPNISECKNLKLKTKYSYLTDYYAMKYERFPDFLNYIEKVTMVGNLSSSSEVGIQDIVYFAPELNRFKDISVRITGKGLGTVHNLNVTDLTLHDGISNLQADLNFKGLPEIDETYMTGKIKELKTNGAGIYVYAPELRGQDMLSLAALKNVHFDGTFSGLLSAFEATGNLQTNLGNAQAAVKMSLPTKGQTSYAGSIKTVQFELGQLLYQDYIGKVSVDVNVSGKDFDLKKGAIDVHGKINEAEVNGYNYTNVNLNGLVASRQFNGKLQSKDPNFLLDFDGKIDFSKDKPVFDFSAQIANLNAKLLRFTKDSIVAKGNVKLNFTGDNIDNFVGFASLQGLDVFNKGQKLKFDYLRLLSEVTDANNKRLLLHTNGISAKAEGDFSIMDLPNSVQMFLSYYLPQYVKPPQRVNEHQNIDFYVDVSDADDIVSLFSKQLKFGTGAYCKGLLNMKAQQMSVEASVPEMKYGDLTFQNIKVNSTGNYSGLNVNASLNGIERNDHSLISTLQFSTNLHSDTAKFQLLTTTPTTLGSATLNGVAFADRDSFFLNILPSQFYFNQNRWDIPGDNQTIFSKNFIDVRNLVLKSGFQSLNVNTTGNEPSGSVWVKVKDIDLVPVTELFGLEALNLEGNINGDIQSNSVLQNQKIDFNLSSSNLKNHGLEIGTLKTIGSFSVPDMKISLEKGSGLVSKDYGIGVYGNYSLGEDVANNVDAHFIFEKAAVALLQPFVNDYVSGLSGTVDGDFNVKGNLATPNTSGSLTLNKVQVIPDIIGVPYYVEQATIAVTDKKFDVGKTKVEDEDGNQGTLTGTVTHNGLDNLNFRLALTSDNIKVLKLEDYQNPNFYGNVNASVQLRFNGPINNLSLNVFGIPQRNSHLYIPIDYSGDVGTYDYIKFKNLGFGQKDDRKRRRDKYNVRIDAIATPDLETTIIMDPVSKDKIWAKGSGNISLEIPSEGDIKMNGNYTIEEGFYDFSFKQLQVLNFQKQFAIVPGSVIKWNGDVSDADLEISANAQVRARLYDLIVNEVDRAGLSSQEIKDAQLSQMVNVNIQMKGSLEEPDLHFKLDLVEGRSVGSYAYQRLQRVNSDDKELVNQVASLLLLEQFIPPEGFSNSGAVKSGTINNMSEVISTTASSQITNLANKVLGMQDLYIGVRYKNYNLADTMSMGSVNYMNRNEARLNLRKNFLDGRLIIEMGGIYDWGRVSPQSEFTTNLAGDFRVQYLLTPDGRIRFNVFRTSNYDAVFSQLIGRQGAGLSYRKSFNGLSDLFKFPQRNPKPSLKPETQNSTDSSKSAGEPNYKDSMIMPSISFKKGK